MKTQLIGLPLLLAGLLGLPSRTLAEPPSATQADLDRIVVAAATYQSGASLEPLRQIELLVGQATRQPALRQALEASLVALLSPHSTFEARRFACEQLAVIGSDQSLPVLAGLLKNNETVGIACLAIGLRPSAKADEILRAALPELQGVARLQVIGTLGDRRDAKSVNLLAEFARDSHTDVAEAALIALAKIANAPARKAITARRAQAGQALTGALLDASLRTADKLAASGERKAAAAIYDDFCHPAQPLFVRRAAFAARLRLDRDGGQQRILDTLRGADGALKPIAISGIRSLKSKTASNKFARELPNLQPEEQVCLIEALASRGDTAARAAIRDAVSSPDAAVRRTAVAAMGKLDGPASVPVLSQALAKAQDRAELQAIEGALSNLKDDPATDPAIVAEMQRATGAAKLCLISVAAKRGSRAAVPALIQETSAADAATVKAAFQALTRLATADDLPVLLDRLVSLKAPEARPDAESAVARALDNLNSVSSRADVICAALAQSNDVESRCSLLRLLPNCANTKTLTALKAALKDNVPQVRETAVRALADWPDTDAWDALTGICRQPEKAPFRALALRALVRLAAKQNATPDATLISWYRQLSDTAQNDGERKLVLGALAGVAHPEALQLALPLLANSGVRAEAALAVKQIAESIKDKYPQAAQEALQRLKTATP